MKRAARVDSYRGFVFASLVAEGPSLLEFLGEAKVAFDDMCDRSPVGEVEVVPICHRVVQHSNWKFFMENQLDALHPSVTHQSTGVSAARVENRLKAAGQTPPLYYHYAVDLCVQLRPVGQGADDQLPARPRHPERPTWACARRTPTRSSTKRS
jgi:phenylpropionate dioxygenase-like ring-hydroxylating dioxygenase large terminal subunit